MKKMWFIYTVAYHSAVRFKKRQSSATVFRKKQTVTYKGLASIALG